MVICPIFTIKKAPYSIINLLKLNGQRIQKPYILMKKIFSCLTIKFLLCERLTKIFFAEKNLNVETITQGKPCSEYHQKKAPFRYYL